MRTVPSSAVTETVRVLSPARRLLRPVTETLLLATAAEAVTATEVVPYATLIRPWSATLAPLTVKTARSVLLFSAATRTSKV